jgi:hypothetical protein
MKFFIGPVTKNTIDSVINYSNENQVEFVFIPSRRQIDYDGGYVNSAFNTMEFSKYVKSKTNNILIERDHGGPSQGKFDDDGLLSLSEDTKYLDIIHIDPWKKYKNIDEAVDYTIKLIRYCFLLNKDMLYEIGTEEGIRPIDDVELDYFVNKIKMNLSNDIFSKIKYLVIQCGTKLLEQTNIGTFDSKKLIKMIEVCKKYNMIPKEHNGDWISYDTIKNKQDLGLNCINIAPEFGEIESTVILNILNKIDFEEFFQICYQSNAWKKWVSSEFDPLSNKEKLIKICGHYNLNHPKFIEIKSKYKNMDQEICNSIKNKLIQITGKN